MKVFVIAVDWDGLVGDVSLYLTRPQAESAFKEKTQLTEEEVSKQEEQGIDTHYAGSGIWELEVPGPLTFYCTNDNCGFSSQDIVEAKKHDEARHDSKVPGEEDSAISVDLTGIQL